MVLRIIPVREEAGLFVTFQLRSGSQPVGIVGWTFECALYRQAGATDISVPMAGNPHSMGFRVMEGASGIYQLRISAAALAGVTDTTGSFELFGTVFAIEPGGTRHLIEDLKLIVTKGHGG